MNIVRLGSSWSLPEPSTKSGIGRDCPEEGGLTSIALQYRTLNSAEKSSASLPSRKAAWFPRISHTTIKAYSSCSASYQIMPSVHPYYEGEIKRTLVTSRNFSNPSNSRSKFLSLVHMSGTTGGSVRVIGINSDGPEGSPRRGLKGEAVSTGIGLLEQSCANFCKTPTSVLPSSSAITNPLSSSTRSAGSTPFRGVPCSIAVRRVSEYREGGKRIDSHQKLASTTTRFHDSGLARV